MSYTQQKDSIQWEVQECIETYRKGTEKQKRIADRIRNSPTAFIVSSV